LTEHTAFEHYATEHAPALDAGSAVAPAISVAAPVQEQEPELETDAASAETVAPPDPPVVERDRDLFFAFKGRPRFSLFGRRS